jgi:hypothetical protein
MIDIHGESLSRACLRVLRDSGASTSDEIRVRVARKVLWMTIGPEPVRSALVVYSKMRPPLVVMTGRHPMGRGRPGIWEITPAGIAYLEGETVTVRQTCGLGWPSLNGRLVR